MDSSSVSPARALDHIVLPVGALGVARNRLTALGFTVAADALHPFGTENACVYFSEGGYLEPLGVADPEKCHDAIRQGNVFVARHEAFRADRGEGLSAIIAESRDADADHARFEAEGRSAGKMLSFERPVQAADGSEAKAGFKLAFAKDEQAPDLLLFACERLLPLAVDKEALARHDNGAMRVSGVILTAEDPSIFEGYIDAVFQAHASATRGGGLEFAAGGTQIEVMTPDGFTRSYGLSVMSRTAGLEGAGLVFAVGDLGVTGALLAANGISHEAREGRLVVPPSAGQGVTFIFEDKA